MSRVKPLDLMFITLETASRPLHMAGFELFAMPARYRGDYIADLVAATESRLDPTANESVTVPTASEVTEAVASPVEAMTEVVEEDPVPQAVPEPPVSVEPDTAMPLPEAEPETETEADVVAEDTTPGSTLIQSLVTVYERDGAARITFRRPTGAAGTLVWWTADHSAIGERDYIPLEQPVAAFTSVDEAETLHIPLVNDGLPEPRETFYVYLGQRNPASGALEPIARVRVDINDDD